MSDVWDAAIIGAGPAGSVAAYLLARRGWRVLLLERSEWPREKVCGGCINAAAVRMLDEIGVGAVVEGDVAEPLNRFELNVRGRRLGLALPEGVAIARSTLDQRLVAAAVDAGVTFQSGAAARLLPTAPNADVRQIQLPDALVQSRLVLACDGISGTSLEQEPWATWQVSPAAWFGVSTTLHDVATPMPRHTIGMNVGAGGYVGTARLPGNALHLAAALDAEACRSSGGPALLMARILEACEHPLAVELAGGRLRGTGFLTRQRQALGGHRVLAVGDACGYVEPFTGEGIAWAIRGAREVVDLLPATVQVWPMNLPDVWRRQHACTIARQQRMCRLLRRVVRHPALASAGIVAGRALPSIAHAIARRVGNASSAASPSLQGVGL